MLKLGNKSISNLFIGQKAAMKAFLGQKLVWQKATGLPYDAEVEYLESTGTQWIDTSITPQLTGIHKLNFTPSVQSPAPWGCLNFTEISGYGRYFATSGQGLYPRLVGVNYLIEVDGISKKIIVNGNEETPLFSFRTSASGNCWLFGRSDTGVLGSLKIYSASSTDANGTLVRDFIPVRKGTVGYLYDRVSGKLFGNQGTGDFVLGPDVVPVEYIESHGTEYIDTGMPLQSGDIINARVYVTNDIPNNIFGARAGVSNRNIECAVGQMIDGGIGRGGYLYVDYNSSNYSTYRAAQPANTLPSGWYDIVCSPTLRAIYGATDAQNTTVNSDSFTTATNCYLFDISGNPAFSNKMRGRMASLVWYRSSAAFRSFRPVRVGSGSTWEGAMMDVLTRRIYRNAGTGAFTYGNDISIEEELRLLTGEHDEGLYVSDEDDMNLIKEEYNGN